MMTSLCTEYWQVMLAQGVVTGIGSGLLFVPATALLPQYFAKRRNLAATIAAAGSGFGKKQVSFACIGVVTTDGFWQAA